MPELHNYRHGMIGLTVWLCLCSASAWAGTLRDPTRPYVAGPRSEGSASPAPRSVTSRPAPAVVESVPVLSAIIFGDARRRAVIDRRTVAEGERCGSSEVVRIEAERVIVRRDGRETALYLVAPVRKESTPRP